MLSRRSLLALWLFYSVVILSWPAQARVVTFRDEAKVQVTYTEDHDLGAYLAYLLALRGALSQAHPFMAEQAFITDAKIDAAKIDVLAYLLIQHKLSYVSKVESQGDLSILHKIKLDYETLRFPSDISEIYLKSIGDWVFVQYLLQQNQDLEKALTTYLREIKASPDKAYQRLLRETKGKNLTQKYQAFQLQDVLSYHLGKGETDQALETLDKMVTLNPDSVAYKIEYALLLMHTATARNQRYQNHPERNEQALALTSELIGQVKDEGGVRLVRSLIYFNQGLLLERALEDVNQVIALNANNNFAHLLKGLISLKMRNRSQAQKSFETACELTSKDRYDDCKARALNLLNRRFIRNQMLRFEGLLIH